MQIGSNNSLTYLTTSSWLPRVFKWIGKCQSATYMEQYEYCGVRLFDFKLYADKNCHIVAKNGNNKYDSLSLFEILNYLNEKNDVYIKISFDATTKDTIDWMEYTCAKNKFINICEVMETIYSNIKYFGGKNTFDGKRLYFFDYEKKYGKPKIIDKSYDFWIYRMFPFIIGIKNRQNIRKYKNENCFLLLNFVDRR